MVGVGWMKATSSPRIPASGLFVDQLGARWRRARQRGADVLDLVRDVVHPGAATGEMPTGVSSPKRRQLRRDQQADRQRGRLDALVGNGLDALRKAKIEQAFVGGQGRRQGRRRRNPGDESHAAHAADRTGAACGTRRQVRGLSPGAVGQTDRTALAGTVWSAARRFRTVPTVSEFCEVGLDAGEQRTELPSLSSVSFSSSSLATRSSGARCFWVALNASLREGPPSVRRACSLSRKRFVSSESA